MDAGFCPSCGASFKTERAQVIVVTTPTVPGYQIVKVLGTVHGLTVRTRGIGGKIVAGIEGMFGGEVTSYSSEAEKARRDSLERLIEKAAKMGANAVVGADFETSDILQGTATLFSAYGTAVVIEPIKK
ncbi:YbjQ family protein [Candidatus Bathyarchaeota archaeon]|nr:YbjQ family protein [Candidatus Bathyarchaeota archaeon]